MAFHCRNLCLVRSVVRRGLRHSINLARADENLPGDQTRRDHLMNFEPLIVCENLVKIYRLNQESGATVEVQALQGLDIIVAEGEMLGIVGASGSGKST